MSHINVARQILTLFEDALNHDGHAELRIDIRFLRRGQKEVVLHAGKQYRFVLDYPIDGRSISAVLGSADASAAQTR